MRSFARAVSLPPPPPPQVMRNLRLTEHLLESAGGHMRRALQDFASNLPQEWIHTTLESVPTFAFDPAKVTGWLENTEFLDSNVIKARARRSESAATVAVDAALRALRLLWRAFFPLYSRLRVIIYCRRRRLWRRFGR